jgi:arylsulfatase A-like enzyme
MEDRGSDAYRGDLNRQCVTIAEALNPAGYRAYAVGKWHVTRHAGPKGPKDNWPLQRGFGRYYGTITGAGSFYDPCTLVRDNTMISAMADPEYTPATYFYTDAISDHAVRFIDEHVLDPKAKDRPFFLYVAYTAAHWPMHALPEDIARYKGKYDGGYEPLRQARFAKAAALGLVDREQGLTDQAIAWGDVKDPRWESAGMEVYAAMIDRMDQGIGKIVAELRRNGQLDNTLILFLQDNGGCAETMGRAREKGHPTGPRADRPSLPPMKPDELQPIGPPIQTRDGYPVRQGPDVYPGPADSYVAYGRGWANASNTPFREYKHWVHEGGISTPLIAHWPAGIDAGRRGQFVRDPAHLVDLMATCVDLAGATYPATVDGRSILPREGISLRPALSGQALVRGQPIFWEHEGNRAVRDGRWKLVAKHKQPWELYDMDADRTERHDLAATMSGKVEELAARWEAWAARVGVRPWPLGPSK